jgi:hypothetical protein
LIQKLIDAQTLLSDHSQHAMKLIDREDGGRGII